MVATIVKEDTSKDIAELIAERAERGRGLHLVKRQLITKTGEDSYTVPSEASSTHGARKTYAVRYGSEVESCECTDFQVHREAPLACKHLVAVALIYARRRRVHSTCEVCGVGSHEKTLVGIKNDRRRGGPRWCLPHHPESMSQTFLSGP